MDKKDGEFLTRINETFRSEANEHLNAFSSGLIELKKPQSQESYAEIIESMFREIHSLKGAARSIDKKDIESICQPLESVFSSLKHHEISLTQNLFGIFCNVEVSFSRLITEYNSELSLLEKQSQRELIKQLKELTDLTSKGVVTSDPVQIKELLPLESNHPSREKKDTISDLPRNTRSTSDETVRIRLSKLDPILLQSEELIQSKNAMKQRIYELAKINLDIAIRKSESMKWKEHRFPKSSNLLKEWNESNSAFLNNLESQLFGYAKSVEHDHYILSNMVDHHLEALRQILMLPVSIMTEVFPGMVKKISCEQGKEINFFIKGAELEIDKRILDELKDPLIHLLRNSIDHGIGKPDDRILQNKPVTGTINLAFTAQEGGMIEIMLSDDGNGISKEKLLKAAIKSGYLTKELADKLDQKEILSLIYKSGISTSAIINDISGRGLGLSIVLEKVEKLNGKITVETQVNSGTTFRILLPMTLATFRGILVKTNEFTLVLPTINVEYVLKVDRGSIKTVKWHETIKIDDKIILFADLGKVLGFTEQKYTSLFEWKTEFKNSDQIIVIVIISGDMRIAFRVDEVVDEQQILLKSLGKLLRRVRNFSGATILGSGKVVPVLHVPDLIESALLLSNKTQVRVPHEKPELKKILVADDSITSRTLIKNILETAGYLVSTAIDGTDAYIRASGEEFNLIVSDVDMPRMNGFELTTKIRRDQKLCEIPIVLVTALGSREDQERGIEAGADAYIIKSSFDQTDLLKIIQKLI